MLEEDEEKEIVVEIDDDLALKTCKLNNYKYAVIHLMTLFHLKKYNL